MSSDLLMHYKGGMGRPRVRSYRTGTGVAQAVEAVGGVGYAAAYCEVTQEAVYQWLDKGFVPGTVAAVRLARATLMAGKPVSIPALAGLEEQHKPTGTDGRAAAQKGGKASRTSPRILSSAATLRVAQLAA